MAALGVHAFDYVHPLPSFALHVGICNEVEMLLLCSTPGGKLAEES